MQNMVATDIQAFLYTCNILVLYEHFQLAEQSTICSITFVHYGHDCILVANLDMITQKSNAEDEI